MALTLSVRIETWPIAGSFTIARGARTEAAVVVAELSDGPHTGRGECVPYARYGETVDGVAAAIEAMRDAAREAVSTAAPCSSAMPAGAARNALDCAFWDLEAKRAGKPVHELAGLPPPRPLTTAYTISLGTPEAMADAAARAARATAAQGQARRRRRSRRASRAVRAGGAARRADRRCQRRLDGQNNLAENLAPARRPASR